MQEILDLKGKVVVDTDLHKLSDQTHKLTEAIDQFISGKCKDLQRQWKVHHNFCLGGIFCIKLLENGSPVKLHHINDIPNFSSDSDIEN